MVNLSEVLLGGMQKKYMLSEIKSTLVCRFKNVDCSRNISMDVGIGNLLMTKCSQPLRN